jgi:hypothetical protein
MTNHKFEVGTLVRLTTPIPRAAEGEYKVVGQLPVEGNVLQYRIKSEREPNERVVKEYQLRVIN